MVAKMVAKLNLCAWRHVSDREQIAFRNGRPCVLPLSPFRQAQHGVYYQHGVWRLYWKIFLRSWQFSAMLDTWRFKRLRNKNPMRNLTSTKSWLVDAKTLIYQSKAGVSSMDFHTYIFGWNINPRSENIAISIPASILDCSAPICFPWHLWVARGKLPILLPGIIIH